jgi:hypothetical protein
VKIDLSEILFGDLEGSVVQDSSLRPRSLHQRGNVLGTEPHRLEAVGEAWSLQEAHQLVSHDVGHLMRKDLVAFFQLETQTLHRFKVTLRVHVRSKLKHCG